MFRVRRPREAVVLNCWVTETKLVDEFLRRFFLHVLPRGFVRILHFGFFAHRRRAALLPLCFALLGQTADSQTVIESTPTTSSMRVRAPMNRHWRKIQEGRPTVFSTMAVRSIWRREL